MSIGPLQVLCYPHPALKHVSKPLKRVDAELVDAIRGMFPLMYESRGVGLAANQVGLPFRFFVVNAAADPAEGEEFVFINPVISGRSGTKVDEEGCLSFPGIYTNISRAEKVKVTAFNIQGRLFEMTVSGLMARIIQHENDHLDGIVFPERADEDALGDIQVDLANLDDLFLEQQADGTMPPNEELERRLAELELKYC